MNKFISVGVIISDEKNNLLLQRRDNKITIYFPGLWGLFGGACETFEEPYDAAIREIYEELNIKLNNLKHFLTLQINSIYMGKQIKIRHFYTATISVKDKKNIVLSEGSDYNFFKFNKLPSMKEMVSFDLAAMSLYLHTNIEPRSIIPNKVTL